MILLGKKQTLQVVQTTDFGVYLAGEGDENKYAKKRNDAELPISKVLLPKNQLRPNTTLGDSYEVFIYKDSEDRPIATTTIPPMELNEFALLTVKEVSTIGAFLDWGLAKDLLLPFKEQTYKVNIGDSVLVKLYIDKSKRLCATMKIYEVLRTDSEYKRDDMVKGTVYEIIDSFGAFVAVDNCYSAMIPKNELFHEVKPGDQVEARVTLVHEDGKLDLSLRQKAYLQMDDDSTRIYEKLVASDGFLPYHDKSDAEEIKQEFNLSKNAFKRAIGRLMKEGKIVIQDNGIKLK